MNGPSRSVWAYSCNTFFDVAVPVPWCLYFQVIIEIHDNRLSDSRRLIFRRFRVQYVQLLVPTMSSDILFQDHSSQLCPAPFHHDEINKDSYDHALFYGLYPLFIASDLNHTSFQGVKFLS